MPEPYEPFIKANPGDLISDELWNDMQREVRKGIEERVEQALENVEKAASADSALESERIGGKTYEELKQDILDAVLQIIPTNTGYRRLYKVLNIGEQSVIEHGLKQCPLVDIYQLDYFQVACAEDDDKFAKYVTFYLYHSSEKKIKFKDSETGNFVTVEIEPKNGHPYKILLSDLLERLEVSYKPTTSLGDLETELWKKFFADPNDEFEDDQYCHSPWFERCCREEKSVQQLKASGDWNDLWFQVRPRKTINYPVGKVGESGTTPAPTQLQVEHFDFDTLGLTLLQEPPLPVPPGVKDISTEELKVMVLLKV